MKCLERLWEKNMLVTMIIFFFSHNVFIFFFAFTLRSFKSRIVWKILKLFFSPAHLIMTFAIEKWENCRKSRKSRWPAFSPFPSMVLKAILIRGDEIWDCMEKSGAVKMLSNCYIEKKFKIIWIIRIAVIMFK